MDEIRQTRIRNLSLVNGTTIELKAILKPYPPYIPFDQKRILMKNILRINNVSKLFPNNVRALNKDRKSVV